MKQLFVRAAAPSLDGHLPETTSAGAPLYAWHKALRGLTIPRSAAWPAVGALALLILAFLAYSPVLPGSFIMDDQRLVHSDNPLVNGQLTPATLWFQTDFPLSNLAFWAEWNVWGHNPAGYHVVGIALHAFSAVLLWRLLAKLKINGAWLAGALFAVHPVCVNSVARIAEIKNTLSLPFFLLSILFYLRYEAAALYPSDPSAVSRAAGTRFYTLSLLTFALALLSKTSTVMVPVVLLMCGWWQRARLTRRDVLHTTPHFALALGFGLMSIWFQKHQALASAGESVAPSPFTERLANAACVFWFYLGKALAPINLNLVYPQWKLELHSVMAFMPAILVCALFALCWHFRHGWGRHALFGLGCFLITLFPALGFFDAQFLTRWQVSDHLQYLPLICIVALVAAGMMTWLKKRTLASIACIALLAGVFALGFQRAEVFASEESLMRDSLAKNPAASEAHNDLGTILARRNEISEALAHFAAAVQSNPNNAAAHLNLGQALAMRGDVAQAESHLRTALNLKPSDAATHVQLANLLSRTRRFSDARLHLQLALCFKPSPDTHLQLAGLLYSSSKYRDATAHLRKALALEPKSSEAMNNLAWLLATCADNQVRDGVEAVLCAEQACQLTRFKHAGFMSTLAAAYAEAGRFSEAVAMAEAALELQTAAGDEQSARVNRQLLTLFRAGKAYHEPPLPMQADL